MENSKLAQEFHARSLLRFALPNIIMMIFLSLYTIVDGMFVAKFVNTTALAATNIVYPLMALELGIGIMLATGGCAAISKMMGEGQLQKASEHFTFVAVFCLVLGILFTIFGRLFLNPIISLLQATSAQFPYAVDYLGTLFYFVPAFFLQLYFQYLFTAAGRPDLGLFSTVLSGVLNVVLDYFFIHTLDMGILGAAIATGIGYCATDVIGIYYFFHNPEGLHFVPFEKDFPFLKRIALNGSSEMVGNLANAITTFLFNIAMLEYYGDDGVAAITILFYYQFVFVSIFFGYAAGVAPVISYKYGQKNYDQLKKLCRISIYFILISSLLMFTLSECTIHQSMRFFVDPNQNVYDIGVQGFKTFAFCFLFIGFPVLGSSLFTALNNGKISAIIAFLRTFVFIVLNLFFLPKLFGADGLWLTIPVAEFFSMLVAIYFYLTQRKNYGY